jgi:hypothetical protein
MERVALSDVEIDMLKTKLENAGLPLFVTLAASFLISLMFIFSHGKHNTPSIYDNHGFWVPAMIINAIQIVIFSYYNKIEQDLLEKDLFSEKKTIEEKAVWKKDKTLMSGKHRIWINSDIKTFTNFEVNEKEYNAIEKGHKVVLEYAQHSKFLFRLDLKLS